MAILRPLMLALLASPLLISCVTNPVTGRSQLMLVSESQAISASAQAYTAEMQQLQKQGKLSDDKALIRRVETITAKLIAQAVLFRPDTQKWDWSVRVINDPKTVNAFCMAGGRMAIYTGIIEQLKLNDDEIAQIMGHEIAHALSNHTAEKMSMAMATNLTITAFAAYKQRSEMALAGAALAAAVAVQLPNSRTAESESDVIGIELAAKAGYDPRAAVSLWRKMSELGGGRGEFDWFSTHPSPQKRMDELNRLVPKMDAHFRTPGARPVYPLKSALGNS